MNKFNVEELVVKVNSSLVPEYVVRNWSVLNEQFQAVVTLNLRLPFDHEPTGTEVKSAVDSWLQRKL